MREVRFESAEETGETLELLGPTHRASVAEVLPGVFRVCVRPKRARSKTSTVIEPAAARPLRLARDGERIHLAGDGGPLVLQLDPFRLRFHDVASLRLLPDPPADREGLPARAGLTLEVADRPARRYLGLGERTGRLDHRGRRLESFTTDEGDHHPGADPLYQAHPFLLLLEEGRALGLYLDETWRTWFELPPHGSDAPVRIHTDGPTFDLYLVAGPSPRDVVTRFTALTGRSPLPPLWALGYHQCRYSYETAEDVREVAARFRESGIPLDALWLDIDGLDAFKVFTFDRKRFPRPAELVGELGRAGIRTVVIVDPGVKRERGYPPYDLGKRLGAFVKDEDGGEVVGGVWADPCVWPDFSREDVRTWWGDLHRGYLDAGIAGIWNDMNEPAAFTIDGQKAPTLPSSARHEAGTHAELHNLYGSLMCRATFDGLRRFAPARRPFVLTRSGFTGVARWAFVWTGDNASHWEQLEQSLPMLANLGMSGVPFIGADIGGFNDHAGGELLARWTWLGAFYPFMRNHSRKHTRRQEPWCFGEPYLSAVREAIRFRYRLLPFMYTLAREACDTGLPPLRPLLLEHPADGDAVAAEDQLLLGRDLLVAPIVRPGRRHRAVYLPAGDWAGFFDGARTRGPAHLLGEAALDRIPLYQRAGSAIPMTEPAEHTTDAWWEDLIWRVAPAPEIHGVLFEDDGDGDGPGATSELEGSASGGRLRLVFRDRAGRPRRRVVVELLGPDGSLRRLDLDRELVIDL